MRIQPIGMQNYAHKNINNPNFTASNAAAITDTFISTKSGRKEPQKPGYAGKIAQLKPYNIDFISTLKIMALPKEDYDTVLREIKENPEREQALREGRSKLTFVRENKDDIYENMDEIKTEYSYTEESGYFLSTRLKTRKGANRLNVRRKEGMNKEGRGYEINDTSSFNPKYTIKNRFREFNTTGKNNGRGVKRDIEIKTATGKPLLNYSYAKSALTDSKLSKCYMNGREYVTKISDDGKVSIVSGKKGSRMDFLSRLDTDSIRNKNGNKSIEDARVEAKKATFVKALKLLPPQILCEMDDDFDTFKNGRDGANGRELEVNLFCTESAAESMLMGTIEHVAVKKGLVEEKELKDIFAKERENYINWLNKPKDNCLIMQEDHYLNEMKDPKTDLMETIKKICTLLWMEEYDKGKVEDETMRLLLNFFPKTVSYVVSKFELNNI